MSFSVKTTFEKIGPEWSATAPKQGLSTTGHKTLDGAIVKMQALINEKVLEDSDSPRKILTALNTLKVTAEYTVDFERNHSIEEFISPRSSAEKPVSSAGDLPFPGEHCRDCGSFKGKKQKSDCFRYTELFGNGGSLTPEQLIKDVDEYGCAGFKKKESSKTAAKGALKVGSHELKKAAEAVNQKGSKGKTPKGLQTDPCKGCEHYETCPDHNQRPGCVTDELARQALQMRKEEDEDNNATPLPPSTCETCEGADRCTRKDPKVGCMADLLREEAATLEAKNKKGRIRKVKGASTGGTIDGS